MSKKKTAVKSIMKATVETLAAHGRGSVLSEEEGEEASTPRSEEEEQLPRCSRPLDDEGRECRARHKTRFYLD